MEISLEASKIKGFGRNKANEVQSNLVEMQGHDIRDRVTLNEGFHIGIQPSTSGKSGIVLMSGSLSAGNYSLSTLLSRRRWNHSFGSFQADNSSTHINQVAE